MSKLTITSLSSGLAAGLLACVGCTNADVPSPDRTTDAGEQIVQIRVKLPSRAPQAPERGVVRRLESSNAYQAVQDLKVYFFYSDTEDGIYVPYQIEPGITYLDFSDYFKKTEIWDDQEKGMHQQHTFTGDDIPTLKAGYYKLMAKADEGKVEGQNQYQNYSFEGQSERFANNYMIVNYETSPMTSEIFIGFHGGEDRAEIDNQDGNCAIPGKYAAPIHIGADGDPLYAEIELRRAVTGVLLYVENIPSRMHDDRGDMQNVYHMALVPTTYTTKWALNDYCFMDVFNDNKINDVRNNLVGVKPILQYSFANMWNENGSLKDTANSGAFANFGTDTSLPVVTAEHPHAVRLGQFIPPIQSETVSPLNFFGYDIPTMYLVFYDKAKNPICKRPIYMVDPKDDRNKADTQYFLYANHIYTIGTLHYKADGHTPDDDRPIDLRDYENDLYIIAHGNWQEDVSINF